jgi:hypothetical protein
VATSNRPCGRISRSLAFGATGKGEARTASLEGTEAGATDSTVQAYGAGVKDRPRSIQRTAVYGPVCTVVWEGEAARPTPIPIVPIMIDGSKVKVLYPA